MCVWVWVLGGWVCAGAVRRITSRLQPENRWDYNQTRVAEPGSEEKIFGSIRVTQQKTARYGFFFELRKLAYSKNIPLTCIVQNRQ